MEAKQDTPQYNLIERKINTLVPAKPTRRDFERAIARFAGATIEWQEPDEWGTVYFIIDAPYGSWWKGEWLTLLSHAYIPGDHKFNQEQLLDIRSRVRDGLEQIPLDAWVEEYGNQDDYPHK